MKSLYLDTSVVLGYWASTDPNYDAITNMFRAIKNDVLKGFISTLGLCEIASVVERQKSKFERILDVHGRIFDAPLSIEYLKAIITIPNVFIVTCPDVGSITIHDKVIKIPSVTWKAIKLAAITKLRSLDNLHLAIACSLSDCLGEEIDYFVTNDNEIINRGATIKKSCNFPVISPKELVRIEGL